MVDASAVNALSSTLDSSSNSTTLPPSPQEDEDEDEEEGVEEEEESSCNGHMHDTNGSHPEGNERKGRSGQQSRPKKQSKERLLSAFGGSGETYYGLE